MAFGDDRQFLTSLAQFSHTSTSFASKPGAQLAFSIPIAGTYMVGYSLTYQTDSQEGDIECRLWLDGAVSLMSSVNMNENDPGNAPADSHLGFTDEDGAIALGVGAHTIDVQTRRNGGGGSDEVSISNYTVWVYRMDTPTLPYFNDRNSGEQVTTSSSYQQCAQIASAVLAAGDYRITASFACRQGSNLFPFPGAPGEVGVRVRERRDPAGANVITNLLGDNSGGADELRLSDDPALFASRTGNHYVAGAWVVNCRVLVADTYTFEMHFREIGGGINNDVGIARRMLAIQKMP